MPQESVSHRTVFSLSSLLTLWLFSRHRYPEQLTGAIRVKCLAQGHINIFQLVVSGIRTSDHSVTGPTRLTARLPAASSLMSLFCSSVPFVLSLFSSFKLPQYYDFFINSLLFPCCQAWGPFYLSSSQFRNGIHIEIFHVQ